MKVLMLNYEYPPLGGGAANATAYLLREFENIKNIQIDLVTSTDSGKFEIKNRTSSITIYKVPVHKKNIHYWKFSEILSYTLQARSLIKKMKPERYDIIHAFFGIPCGVLAHNYRSETPYIVSLRGSDVPGFNERFSFIYIFLTPIIRQIWRDASVVIANSVGLRDLAHQTEPDLPIDIIPNGIDIQAYPIRYEYDDGLFIILVVARLIRRKGIGDLIRAIPYILKECPNLKIRIIGEGNLEAELRSQALDLGVQKYIEFLGYVPHENLPKFYSNSDVFILPSQNEGMSNTILEAMAAGLPIITTNTGGTWELIEDNGLVISIGDPHSIAEAVLQYVRDPKLRKEHGFRSRERAETMDWAHVAEKYYHIYSELL